MREVTLFGLRGVRLLECAWHSLGGVSYRGTSLMKNSPPPPQTQLLAGDLPRTGLGFRVKGLGFSGLGFGFPV